jgi:hypothetical protein
MFPSFSKHNAGPSSTLSLILYGLSSTPWTILYIYIFVFFSYSWYSSFFCYLIDFFVGFCIYICVLSTMFSLFFRCISAMMV